MEQSLFQFVMAGLQARKGQKVGNLADICRETGLEYSWLTKLASGDIPDPSVNKIQRLADYFRKQEAAA